MATNNHPCPFDNAQVKTFVKEAVKRVGGKEAWAFIGPEVRRLAIEAACFRAFANLLAAEKAMGATVKPSEMYGLRERMMKEAGIED